MGEPAAAIATTGIRALVAVDRIDVGERLRAVDPDWAAALAVSIEKDGLVHPVMLRPLPGGRLRLVVGAHRLAAHRVLGWPEIEAEIVDMDAVTARSRQVAENVMRRELSPLDRAAFIAELYEVEKVRSGWEEDQSQQAFAISRRWSKDTAAKIAAVSGLQALVSEKVGLSERAIRYDLSLFRDLAPAVRALLATHPVAENASQLRLLARSGEQLRIAQLLVDGKAADVGKALDLINPRAPVTPQAKTFSAFVGAWSRMGVVEQRQALKWLAAERLPKGFKITTGGKG